MPESRIIAILFITLVILPAILSAWLFSMVLPLWAAAIVGLGIGALVAWAIHRGILA
jgi:hypothetical protein